MLLFRILNNDSYSDNIRNATTFSAGEKFILSLIPSTTQMVYQIKAYPSNCNIHFENGKCKDKLRTTERNPKLEVPKDIVSECNIIITAAWASSYSSGVKITPAIVLHNKIFDDKTNELKKEL